MSIFYFYLGHTICGVENIIWKASILWPVSVFHWFYSHIHMFFTILWCLCSPLLFMCASSCSFKFSQFWLKYHKLFAKLSSFWYHRWFETLSLIVRLYVISTFNQSPSKPTLLRCSHVFSSQDAMDEELQRQAAFSDWISVGWRFICNQHRTRSRFDYEWLQRHHTTEPSQKVLQVIKVKGIQKIRHCSVRWGRARQ